MSYFSICNKQKHDTYITFSYKHLTCKSGNTKGTIGYPSIQDTFLSSSSNLALLSHYFSTTSHFSIINNYTTQYVTSRLWLQRSNKFLTKMKNSKIILLKIFSEPKTSSTTSNTKSNWNSKKEMIGMEWARGWGWVNRQKKCLIINKNLGRVGGISSPPVV